LDAAVVSEPSAVASARVASAVLAIRIADSDTRVATTQTTQATTTTEPDGEPTAAQDSATTEAASPPDAPLATTTARDTTPPPIKVTSHDDGDTVSERTVTFSGTSERGAVVTSGPFAAEMAESGDWQLKLMVKDGDNGASFTATDEAGNEASVRIVVHYDEPQTTTTKAPKTTTTKPASTTTTTKGSTSPMWSPNWPADSGGIRNVEAWRPLVEKYWAADRVDCVLGIIKKESRGDPRAYNSYSSAEGLMQHLSKYWKSRAAAAGFRDSNGLYASPYNAEANIAAGAQIAGSGSSWYIPWGYTPAYGTCPDSRG
jgi:hypothetical protein